jgi:hypothetical protein
MKALVAARAALLGAALTTPPSMALAQAGPAGSLCQAPEAVLFTCRMETKTVSICGQQHKPGQDRAGTDQAAAVYRYGRQGRVELEITDLHRAFEGWAGGGETQVYADTPTHRYIVYDRLVRTGVDKEGHSLSQMTQGLLVRNGGRTILSRHCTYPTGAEPPAFDQRRIEALLPQGEYLPH